MARRTPRAPGTGDAPMPAVSAAPQNADMLAFLTDAPHMALRAGQVLFTEGDPPNSMYVVRSGTLRIRSGGVIYEDVGAGGIVGEMALVEHYPARSATVYALTDSELVAVDEAHFSRWWRTSFCPQSHADSVEPTAQDGSAISP